MPNPKEGVPGQDIFHYISGRAGTAHYQPRAEIGRQNTEKGSSTLRHHSSLITHHSSLITVFLHFASSGCRFYCRFWLPLLVAVLQVQIIPQYNIVGNRVSGCRLPLSPAASQKRPHKKSAANYTYVPWLHNANREPERGEGSAANLKHFTRFQNVNREPERSEGSVLSTQS